MNEHTLINHKDIRTWVDARRGQPAFIRVPTETGEVRAELALNFPRGETVAETPKLDSGAMNPCSWTAWLAELDRQKLALRVSDRGDPDFAFVDRKGLH
jgi:hypothetical protein